MVNFLELEYKFNADNVKFSDFENLMETVGYNKSDTVSSWDYYFTVASEQNSFIRFRDSSTGPELTKKIKTSLKNNFKRIEIDLPLNKDKLDKKAVFNFLQTLNYSENFRIYKTCCVFWLDNVNYVYYIVYDKDLKESGRFIEVEVNKERVGELGEAAAKKLLTEAESKLLQLGLNSKSRLVNSLFELYKEEIPA